MNLLGKLFFSENMMELVKNFLKNKKTSNCILIIGLTRLILRAFQPAKHMVCCYDSLKQVERMYITL